MRKIRRVDVLSVAMVLAAVSLVVAFLFVVIGWILAMLDIAYPLAQGVPVSFGLPPLLEVLVWFPLYYAIRGFIGGAVAALVYNLIAGKLAVRIELE